jgi:DNA-binding PadR family transcriptional regulator
LYCHGHAIAKHIQRTSEDFLKIETGPLYPALYRLEANGWISASWTTSDKSKRARYDRLTARGRRQRRASSRSGKRSSVPYGCCSTRRRRRDEGVGAAEALRAE